MKKQELSFPSADGTHQVAWTLWEPDGPVRGVVQLVHGVAEYIDRYHDFACFLTEQGFAVAGDDHLGHGRTAGNEPELGWFAEKDGWKIIVEDEKRLRDILRAKYPGMPMVLFGHSMGSFMARTYLMRWPDDFTCCVLSGTGHQSAVVCRFGKLLAGLEIKRHGGQYRSALLQKIAFGSYLKRVDDPVGPNDWICTAAPVVRQYDADPKCGFTATAGLMYDMMDGLGIIGDRAGIEKMNKALPVLFIAGEEDPVGAYGKGVRHVVGMFRKAGMADVTVKLYPAMRHEVLNERDKETVWRDVLDWIVIKIKS